MSNNNTIETTNVVPTEEEVLNTIFNSVSIRGIDLRDYERNFSNTESGLYDSLIKLFKK